MGARSPYFRNDTLTKCAQAEFDDTWVYDPGSNQWRQILFSGSSGTDWPSKREGHSLAPAGGERLVLFGGAGQGQPQGDTWILYTFSSSLQVVWNGTDQGGQRVPDGTYTLLLTVTDPEGLLDTASGQVTVDTQPPALSLSASPDPLTSPGPVTVSLTSTEPLASSPLVTVTPPGGPPVPLAMSGGGQNWSGSYEVSSEARGPGTVTLTVEADQPLSWGPRLSLVPPGGKAQSIALSPAGTNRWRATYSLGACSPNGTYLVRAWGKDGEGDLGVGETSFQVSGITTSSDTEPPRIRFWYPRNGSMVHLPPGESLTVYVLVEDGCVGVDGASAKIWADHELLSGLSFSPRQGRISFRWDAPSEGTHRITVEVPDQNGNLAVESWYFRVAHRRR